MFGNCLDKYYHKRTWYTQTFLCQFLCGRNKNQFFHYFSLLCDLLHHQDLPNKWFERRLNVWQCFSPFLENIFHLVVCIFWIPKVTLKWNDFGTFWLSKIPISCIWVEYSVWIFLSAPSIENSKPCQSGIITSTSLQEFCRNFICYIWKSFELILINRL